MEGDQNNINLDHEERKEEQSANQKSCSAQEKKYTMMAIAVFFLFLIYLLLDKVSFSELLFKESLELQKNM